jgi:hypothetical protein
VLRCLNSPTPSPCCCDPSKIAVGFGGTLNLVLELAFLLATLALIAAPWRP